jgi:capsular polysaccharide transport system permease protein
MPVAESATPPPAAPHTPAPEASPSVESEPPATSSPDQADAPQSSTAPAAIERAKITKATKKEKSRSIIVLALRALRRLSPAKQEIVPAGPSVISPALGAGSPPPPRRPGFIRRHALFFTVVVIPTLLAALYYGFYASDIYVSESKFVVRSPNKQQTGTSLGALLGAAGGQGAGVGGAMGEALTVGEYISSRDALAKLEEKMNISATWGASNVDLLSRFDPLKRDSSFEALFEYYPKRVSAQSSDSLGVTVLQTSAFGPREAQEINSFLLSEAEDLINNLNNRAREDLITFASNEVTVAEEKAKAAAFAVSEFRNKEGVVDPEAQTQLHFEQISRLQEELIKTRAQLTQLRVFAPESPHPPALELRARTLESEIAAEMDKISGGDDSLASKAAEFQRLSLERGFADQQLAAALASLETARNEAQRQQLYLETISKPSLPDDATQPKRLRSIFTTLALSAIAWGIIAMLVAGVREHQA